MQRFAILMASVALSACSSLRPTGLPGISVSTRGLGQDHIALTPCIEPDAVAAVARTVIPVLVGETIAQGYARAVDLSGLKLCLVEKPAPCCSGGWPCAGPCRDVKYQGMTVKQCARKAGCSGLDQVWASKTWPPRCNDQPGAPRWDDEPHCADLPAPYDWRKTLVHEIGNTIVQRLGLAEGYDASKVSRYYQADGPIACAQEALAAQPMQGALR